MVARTQKDLERIWLNVDGVRKVSDRIVGLGPFGVGLDGLIAMTNAVPGLQVVGIAADQIYTWGAGGWLLLQAINARATAWTITRMLLYLGLDSVVSAVPFLNSVLDLFFQGHAYAARALQRDIETTHWVDASWRDARANGEYDLHHANMRAERKRRLVFLRD